MTLNETYNKIYINHCNTVEIIQTN